MFLIKPYGCQNLVIPAPSGVYFLASLSKIPDKVIFYCGMAVLILLLYLEFSCLAQPRYLIQAILQLQIFILVDNPAFPYGLCMCQRCLAVKFNKVLVKQVIISNCKFLYLFPYIISFVP